MKTAIILSVILLLAACAPVDLDAEAPAPEPVPEPEEIPVEVPEPEPEPEPVVEKEVSPEVEALYARSGEVKSYTFVLSRLPEISGEQTFIIKGNKAKIELITPLAMNGFSADFIYVNYDKTGAMAYCLDYASCKVEQVKGDVPFAEWGVKLPTDWMDDVKYGEKVGVQQFYERTVSVVRWEEDGLFYEAFVDNFYGYPARVSIATDPERTDIIGGFEYQSMGFNTVKDADVEPPY